MTPTYQSFITFYLCPPRSLILCEVRMTGGGENRLESINIFYKSQEQPVRPRQTGRNLAASIFTLITTLYVAFPFVHGGAGKVLKYRIGVR